MGVSAKPRVLPAALLLACLVMDGQVGALVTTVAGGESNEGVSVSAKAEYRSLPDDVPEVAEEIEKLGRRNAFLQDMLNNGPTKENYLHIVCDGIQGSAKQCENVIPFNDLVSDYMKSVGNLNRDPGVAPVRRRRAGGFGGFGNNGFGSSFFNSHTGSNNNHFGSGFSNNFQTSFPSFGGFNNFNNHFPSNTGNNGHTGHFPSGTGHIGGGSFGADKFICPMQRDQSQEYALSPDSENYPALDISQELNASPILANCLSNEVVLPGDQPSVIVEAFEATANLTCLQTQLRLWSYDNQRAGGLCWIMQNFQENVLYKQCTSENCLNCKNKAFNGNVGAIKRCITEFQVESVWSYCPNLVAGSRIIRDRIILPTACTCQSIQCTRTNDWRK